MAWCVICITTTHNTESHTDEERANHASYLITRDIARDLERLKDSYQGILDSEDVAFWSTNALDRMKARHSELQRKLIPLKAQLRAYELGLIIKVKVERYGYEYE